MNKVLWILTLGAWLLAAAPEANAWRCGNLLVEKGVLLEAVLEYCGAPVARDKVSAEGEVSKVERLVYGPDGGLFYTLTFEDGVLTTIEERREL